MSHHARPTTVVPRAIGGVRRAGDCGSCSISSPPLPSPPNSPIDFPHQLHRTKGGITRPYIIATRALQLAVLRKVFITRKS